MKRAKARKAPIACVSGADLQEQLDRRTRELDEAHQQQTATSEVLSIIRRSPADAQPVFDAIVQSAARLCNAIFSVVYLYDNDRLRVAATKNFTAEATSQIYERQELKRPDRSTVGGRTVLDRAIVHVPDVLEDPKYSREFALAGGWRAVLGVPLLRDGQSVGAITVGKREPTPFSDQQIQLLKTFADQAVIAIENVRLFEAEQARTRELSESLEQQTATSEVLKVISSSPGELEPVFNAMLSNATRICEAKFGTLYLRDADGFRAVAATRDAPPAYVEARKRELRLQPSPDGPLGRAATTKQVVRIADIMELQSYRDGHPFVVDAVELGKFRTALAAPMLKNDELIGVITIMRQEVRPFTDKQIELVQNFAAQAVIAIENTRLLNQLRESLEQQTATADVLKVISRSAFNLQTVLDTLVESAARLCNADSASIHRPQGEAYPCIASYGLSPEFQQYLRDHPIARGRGSVLGRVVSEGKTIHVPDVLADAEHALVEQRKLGGYRTVLGVPLRREGEAIGLIRLTRNKVQPFTDKQVELVTTFADQAVIAIENARLLNELRESLQQQTATADVLKVISRSTFDLQTVLNTLTESAALLCEADMATIARQKGDAYHYATVYKFPPNLEEYLKSVPHRPGRGSIIGRTLLEGKVIHLHDVLADPEYRMGEVQKKAGFRTGLGVPLLRGGVPIGVINLLRREVRPFTEKQIELLQTFADQAVIAIENVRLFDEVQARTRDLSESLEQQTATSEVLKVISSSPGELDLVFNAMLENATRICDASYGAMWLREGDAFRNAAFHGALPAAFMEQWRSGMMARLDSNTPLARAAQSRKPLQVADLRDDQAYRDGQPLTVTAADVAGIRTLLGVPMLKDDELVGAIAIYRKEVRPFTDKQVELVKNFAAQAVIAIENARLLNELRTRTNELAQSVGELQALGEVSQAVNSTLELETVLTTIVGRAVQLSHTDTGAIYVFDGERKEFRLHATYGMSEAMIAAISGQHIGLGHGNVGAATAERRPVQVPDIRKEPASPVNEIILREGYRGILVIPLLRPDDIVGALVVRRKAPGEFPQSTIELLQTFADQSVVAIENARLFESVETRTRELAKSLEDLRTTQDRLVQTQKLASLGQLTAGIAHEIKNPLNFVNNFSGVSVELIDELRQALAGANLDTKLRAEISDIADTLQGNLDKVVQHGKRADSIVKNMLLHSREGSGEHRSVDINALVEESLNLAYHGARAEKQGFNITLERSLDPTAGQADVFPQDITRVLLNLISNGFYAATKRKAQAGNDGFEPALAASTRGLGDQVEIRIRDNGTGIPPEVKEKMFNPFFTTKPAGEGTGLGLSISHDIIVKQHGGSIEVDTKPGEFTEIRIILPRAAMLPTERA
jgi:two-component system NtrC family sensor kinase